MNRLLKFSAAGESLEGGEEYVIRNWMNRYSCYVMSEHLTKFSPALRWKAELGSKEFDHIMRFPKRVLKMGLDFFLMLTVRFKK